MKGRVNEVLDRELKKGDKRKGKGNYEGNI